MIEAVSAGPVLRQCHPLVKPLPYTKWLMQPVKFTAKGVRSDLHEMFEWMHANFQGEFFGTQMSSVTQYSGTGKVTVEDWVLWIEDCSDQAFGMLRYSHLLNLISK